MTDGGPYLYRGTTVGWPGNTCLQEQQITCTTTDPLVATLFAIECRNHGRAVILAARRDLFEELIGSDELLFCDRMRRQLCDALRSNLPAMAEVVLDVDRVIEILRELGFERSPVRISGQGGSARGARGHPIDAGHAVERRAASAVQRTMLGDEP